MAKIKQIPIGLYSKRELVTVKSEDGITWELPGYRDTGWYVELENNLYAIYEFDNNDPIFYKHADSLEEAVETAIREII